MCACVSAPPIPPPPPPFARRRHEYLMRRSVFMRLEDGAELREAERDGGGGGKWDGGRFKSHDNGHGGNPAPSCKSLNVIMTTKAHLLVAAAAPAPAAAPAASEQGSLLKPAGVSLGSIWKNEQLPQTATWSGSNLGELNSRLERVGILHVQENLSGCVVVCQAVMCR